MLDKNLQHWSPYNFFECWVHHMKCVVKSYGPSWTFWLNSFLQTNKLHFILYTQKYYSETLTTFGILWFILECQPKLRKSQKCLSHFNMSNLSTSFEDQPAFFFWDLIQVSQKLRTSHIQISLCASYVWKWSPLYETNSA